MPLRDPRLVCTVAGSLYGLVPAREGPVRSKAAPITEKGVPDGNVLDMLMLGTDIRNKSFKTPWEALGFGFKIIPPVLPLTITMVVYVLPIVVYNQARNVYFVLR